jgi:hypothetical protein
MNSNDPAVFNPYPGLRPFDDEHAEYFKGRDRQVDQIIRNLKGERFVSIVGVSGCGKSSLIYAGLIPKLHEGQLLPIPQKKWEVVVTTPYGAPWQRLSEALSEAGIRLDEPSPRKAESRAPTALVNGVRRALADADSNNSKSEGATGEAFALLLVVDQFEEIFHSHAGGVPPDATDFVRTLLLAAGQVTVPIYIVLAMRSDFIGDCARFRDLPEKIDRTQFLVPRMSREDMTAAIIEPAEEEGVAIHPDLVNRLIRDTGDDPDRLPLLQHALSRLWDLAGSATPTETDPEPSRVITLKDYEVVGHIPPPMASETSVTVAPTPVVGEQTTPLSALDRHAESIFNPALITGDGGDVELARRRKQHTERLFRYLTQRESGQRNTRVKKTLRDCARIVFAPTGAPADWQPSEDQMTELAATIDPYRAAGSWFLRPYKADTPVLKPDDLVDITHESLIAGWSRLRRWVDREYQDAREYQWITRAAEKWSEGKGGYLSPEDLARFETWRDEIRLNHAWTSRYGGKLDTVVNYASAWRKETDRLVALNAKEKARKRRWMIVGMLAASGVLAGFFVLWQRAEKFRDQAEAEIVRGYTDTIGRGVQVLGLDRQDGEALWRLAGTPDSQESVRKMMLAKLYGISKEAGQSANLSDLKRLQRCEPQIIRAAAGLGPFAMDFRTSQAPSLAADLAVVMWHHEDPSSLKLLALSLSSLVKHSQGDSKPLIDGANRIVARMDGSKDPAVIESLASSLGSLARHLPGDKKPVLEVAVLKVANQIVALMDARSDPDVIALLASSLGSLAEHLPGDKQPIANGANRIVALMDGNKDPAVIESLASSLGSLAGLLPADKKPVLDEVANQIVALMDGNKGTREIASLASSLGSLAEHLPGDKQPITNGANRIVALMDGNKDPAVIESLASSLGSLPGHLPGDKKPILEVANQIMALMDGSRDPAVIESLASSLGSLAEHLPGDSKLIPEGVNRIMALMEKHDDRKSLASTLDALAMLAKHLTYGSNLADPANSWALSLIREATRRQTGFVIPSELQQDLQAKGQPDPKIPIKPSIFKLEPFPEGSVAKILTSPENASSMPARLKTLVMLDLMRVVLTTERNGRAAQASYELGKWAALCDRKEEVKFAISNALWSQDDSDEGGSAFRALIDPLDQNDLVEILKYPLCTGNAEKDVLEELEEKLRGKPEAIFRGDLWKFIEIAPRLGLDVESPVKRPDGEKILKTLEEENAKWNPPPTKKDLKNP